MHWHHNGTRQLSKPFASKVRPDLKYELSLLSEEEEQERISHLLKTIDGGWLKTSSWIGGSDTPTIAYILCFGEASTVTLTKLVDLEHSSYSILQRGTHGLDDSW
jgi:hypothetical protein